MPPEQFKEIDRLAYVVRAIEHDCSVIPCGAFKLTPTHELRYDENFEGLNAGELENIASWQHFRPPQDEEMKKRISKFFAGSRLISAGRCYFPEEILGPARK